MKHIPFGPGAAPNIVLGLMRIEQMSDVEIRNLIQTAREVGINFLDHADIYGSSWHACERRFGEAMRLSSADRAEFTIQTKCGIVKDEGYFDFSYDHIVRQVEGSLTALGTDYIDVLLLHRPDALVEPEEVARAFDELHASGKVRAFGVSNHTPNQIELLKTAVTQPLIANQLQLSIPHAPLVAQGLAANIEGSTQATMLDGGLLDYSRIHAMAVQAWSPMQSGWFDGVFLGDPRFTELNTVIDRLAGEYGVTPTAIATAWITRHPANMQVVLGTTTASRVVDAAAGSDLPLTRSQWYELLRAAGYQVP